MHEKNNSPLRLLITIVDRGRGQQAADLLKRRGSLMHTILMGRGTARQELLDYLGLGETEKDVVISALACEGCSLALFRLNHEMRLDLPGGGIAFTIPIASVGGARTLNYLRGEPKQGALPFKEAETMETACELIISIVNRGFTDQVMEAAEKAGARGGTVVHARGASQQEAAKFFGLTIQPEKEVVLILVPRDKRSAIMQAIVKGVGMNTLGQGIVFSLPVEEVAGVARMMEPEEA